MEIIEPFSCKELLKKIRDFKKESQMTDLSVLSLDERFSDFKDKRRRVSFGYSLHQIRKKIMKHDGDARRFRQCNLNLDNRLDALQECRNHLDKLDNQADKLIHELRGDKLDKFERRDKQRELQELEYNVQRHDNKIYDAVVETECYFTILNELPDIDRKEFEETDPKYWKDRLVEDAKLEFLSFHKKISKGTLRSLKDEGIPVEWIKFGNHKETGELLFYLEKPKLLEDNQNAKNNLCDGQSTNV